MPFYQCEGSKTYHSQASCSRVPRNVKTNAGWAVRTRRPKAKMCVECAAKAKPKAKPKKRVAKKKRVTGKKSVARKTTRRTRRK